MHTSKSEIVSDLWTTLAVMLTKRLKWKTPADFRKGVCQKKKDYQLHTTLDKNRQHTCQQN